MNISPVQIYSYQQNINRSKSDKSISYKSNPANFHKEDYCSDIPFTGWKLFSRKTNARKIIEKAYSLRNNDAAAIIYDKDGKELSHIKVTSQMLCGAILFRDYPFQGSTLIFRCRTGTISADAIRWSLENRVKKLIMPTGDHYNVVEFPQKPGDEFVNSAKTALAALAKETYRQEINNDPVRFAKAREEMLIKLTEQFPDIKFKQEKWKDIM